MNRIINSSLVVALLALLVVSCQAPQTNVADVRKAIEEGAERWMTAFNAKDAATLASFYAADAIILPPNGPRVSGRANFESLFTGMFAIGSDLKLTISHVDASGDLAYEVGSYTMGIHMPSMPPM
ncbi:MAG: nuclear transport factor 2 family protein, partial [Bacteroidota bacterium]